MAVAIPLLILTIILIICRVEIGMEIRIQVTMEPGKPITTAETEETESTEQLKEVKEILISVVKTGALKEVEGRATT